MDILIALLVLIAPFLLIFLFILWLMLVYYDIWPNINNAVNRRALENFAKHNKLNFESSYRFYSVDGAYCGYYYSLKSSKKSITIKLRRKIELDEKKLINRDIMDRFWPIYDNLKSVKCLEITSEWLVYIFEKVENEDKLQSISDQLIELIETYPNICKMGGEVVDSLLKADPFQPVIWQLIKDIVVKTDQRIKHNKALFCVKNV